MVSVPLLRPLDFGKPVEEHSPGLGVLLSKTGDQGSPKNGKVGLPGWKVEHTKENKVAIVEAGISRAVERDLRMIVICLTMDMMLRLFGKGAGPLSLRPAILYRLELVRVHCPVVLHV